MLKRHLLYTLLMTATFASCSKQSAIVVKEEVAPPPEVYTSTMAIDDLSSVNKSNINEVINRISSRMVNDSDWSYFWKGMNMQNNSYDWDIETLLKIIDLSRISCGKSASASFSNFIQQILNRVEGLEKEQVLIRALNHFETCSLKLNKNLVRELLNLYKSIEEKSTQKQFIKSFSLIVNRPIDEDIVDLIDILDSIEDVEEKLSLYYGLRGSYHYKALSDKVIESFDYKEIIDLSFNEKIDLNDSLEFLTLAKYQQLDLSKEKIEKLFKVINKQYLNASSRLEKYNISKFHYDSLRNLRYLSLSEVEKWAVFALENFEDIGRLYPKGSIQRLFLESFKGQRDEIEFEYTDEKIDQLLVLRSKIQHERDSSISVELYDQLCVLFTDFGVRTFSSSNISDFNKLGCKSFINDGLLKINETVNMPFFSAVHTLGSDIRFDKKPIKLSIINTSQKFIYSKVKDTASTDQYEHIVIPLVFALSPIKDVSRFKVGHKQYLATHYIYKDARLLVPGLDGITRPKDGKKAGDLIFNKQALTRVKFIGHGGEGQEAASAKIGASPYVNELNQSSIRSWVKSFSGNRNHYFSDNFKTVRNLRNLINASKGDGEVLNVYIDPDYVSSLDPEQRLLFEESLYKVKNLEGMSEAEDEVIMEILSRRMVQNLIHVLDNANYSDSLEDLLPTIFTDIELGAGPDGEAYKNGKRGANGQIIIE